MSQPRFDPSRLFFRTFVAAGIISLIVLTLLDRGATRAYATPWNGLLLLVQVAPLLALALRASSPTRPLLLPSTAWSILAAGFATTLLLSGVLSPHRGDSLLGALTPLGALAAFFVVFDWWHHDCAKAASQCQRWAGYFALVIVLMSLGLWCATDLLSVRAYRHVSTLLDHRNAHPLGHSNYTAGLALLCLPWLARRALASPRWVKKIAWGLGAALALTMLFSSGSRGGVLGLAALLAVTIWWARLPWKKLMLVLVTCGTIAAALAYAHPRTRSLVFRSRAAASLTGASDLQRTAMAVAGMRMGADRPVLGWGVASTPFIYPRYRAGLEGGTENVLQLHSTPVQLWADLGALGVAAAAVFLGLLGRRVVALRSSTALPDGSRKVAATAALGLGAYLVFSLTDYQLDVPIFAFALSGSAALLAAPRSQPHSARGRITVVASVLVTLGIVAAFGRPSPAPRLNVQALELAREPAKTSQSIALLRESVALNPHQEISHFNLGWLLVIEDPAAAEQHFLRAIRLVPDKGGVYFGLALARLNQGNREDDAARALALECLNDPLFLTSPWWREPAIGALRERSDAALRGLCERAAKLLDARNDGRARDARYVEGLADWLAGRGAPGQILRLSYTSERVSYFAARPPHPDFQHLPIRAYHRERTGYPVLMRNLDLAPPSDVFEVREVIAAADDLRFLFPAKGWLPSPLLLSLLER